MWTLKETIDNVMLPDNSPSLNKGYCVMIEPQWNSLYSRYCKKHQLQEEDEKKLPEKIAKHYVMKVFLPTALVQLNQKVAKYLSGEASKYDANININIDDVEDAEVSDTESEC